MRERQLELAIDDQVVEAVAPRQRARAVGRVPRQGRQRALAVGECASPSSDRTSRSPRSFTARSDVALAGGAQARSVLSRVIGSASQPLPGSVGRGPAIASRQSSCGTSTAKMRPIGKLDEVDVERRARRQRAGSTAATRPAAPGDRSVPSRERPDQVHRREEIEHPEHARGLQLHGERHVRGVERQPAEEHDHQRQRAARRAASRRRRSGRARAARRQQKTMTGTAIRLVSQASAGQRSGKR